MRGLLILIGIFFLLADTGFAQIIGRGFNGNIILGGYNGSQAKGFDTVQVATGEEFVLTYPKSYKGMGWLKYKEQDIPLLLEGDSLHIMMNSGNILFNVGSSTAFYHAYRFPLQQYQQQLGHINQLQKYYADTSSFGKTLKQEFIEVEKERIRHKAILESSPELVRVYLKAEESLLTVNKILESVEPPSQDQLITAQKTLEENLQLQTQALWHWGQLHRFIYSYYRLSNVLSGGHKHATNLIVSRLGNSPYRNQYIELIMEVLQNIETAPEITEYFGQKALATIEECDDFQEGDGIPGRIKRQMQQLSIMRIGNPVPDQLLDNGKFISDIKSKYKLIVFWGSWCDHCKHEIPQLKSYYSELKKQNVEVIAMGMEDNAEIHKIIASTYPWISHYVGRNWKAPTTESYYVYGTPTFFLVDEAMNIVAKPKSVEELKKWLEVHQ